MHFLRQTFATLCVSFLTLFFGVAAPQNTFSQTVPLATSHPAKFEFDYTGALYGYYRIDPTTNAHLEPDKLLLPVKQFLSDHHSGKDVLLLGMGDNFSPEFGASIQQEWLGTDCAQGANVYLSGKPMDFPQALYKDSDRTISKNLAYCDNVANFLIQAGYRAIIPGREDFLYTADWLRDIALGLQRTQVGQTPANPAWPSNPNNDHKLSLLAANLRVFGRDKKASANTDTQPCQLLFADSTTPERSICTTGDLPTTSAMDWLQRIDRSLDANDRLSSHIACETDLPANKLEPCNNGPSSVHNAGILQHRRTLMENQALQLLSMTSAIDDSSPVINEVKDIRTALKALAKDKSYFLDETKSIIPQSVLPPASSTLVKGPIMTLGTSLELLPDKLVSLPEEPNQMSGQQLLDMLNSLLQTVSNCANGNADSAEAAASYRDSSTANRARKENILQDFVLVGNELVANFSQLAFPKSSLSTSMQSRLAGRRLLLRAIAREQKDVGYTLATQTEAGDPSNLSKTLIIGIIGPDILNVVSPTNLSLGNYPTSKTPPVTTVESGSTSTSPAPQSTKSLKGTVQAMDPLRTVAAVLRGATQMAFDDPANEFDRIVIMAQMSRGEAAELGSQLRTLLRRGLSSTRTTNPDTIDRKNCVSDDPSIPNLCQIPVVILSEAQNEEYSPHLKLKYAISDTIPVITPNPPYIKTGELRRPWSTAVLDPTLRREEPSYSLQASLKNTPPPEPPDVVEGEKSAMNNQEKPAMNNLNLLLKEMVDLRLALPKTCFSPQLSNSEINVFVREKNCEIDLTVQLLGALRRKDQLVLTGDVVLLEQRDIFYGEIPGGYQNYEACPRKYVPMEPDYQKCKLRVALDRVFWKGDYQRRLMVTGSDLTSMLTISRAQGQEDNTLTPTDAFGQSLATFGIAQPESTNLGNPGSNGGEYPIPEDGACGKATGSIADPSTFCVNGQPIQSDAAYWIITSDHLALDKILYKAMAAHSSDYYQEILKEPHFLTASIADGLIKSQNSNTKPLLSTDQLGCLAADQSLSPPDYKPESMPADQLEWIQQQRRLIHLDVAKMVAGFSARSPQGGDSNAQNFQGSNDARASTPSQQELDLESMGRFSMDLPVGTLPAPFRGQQFTWSTGFQGYAEYDRTATGNLTNKPTTVIDALNNFTIGPFLEFRIPKWRGPLGAYWLNSGRALPRLLLVLSPLQYSRQLNGNFLFFPFTQSPPPPGVSGQYTFHSPVVTSFYQKIGLRYEDKKNGPLRLENGSYIEFGFETGVQHNILSALSLATPDASLSTPLTCNALSSITITACFANYANSKSLTYKSGFLIDAKTIPTSFTTASLHAEGVYWDIHLQKKVAKFWNMKGGSPAAAASASSGKSDINTAVNLTFDSKAEWFSPRSSLHSLNTQTHYAIPMAVALNFPVLRNFSLSPTLSTFRYANQVAGQRIQINTFSIQAKWYFAHDATVPVQHQFQFVGPPSADQTASSKMK